MKCIFCGDRILECNDLELLAASIVEPKEAIDFICEECKQKFVISLGLPDTKSNKKPLPLKGMKPLPEGSGHEIHSFGLPSTQETEDVEIGGVKFKVRKG